MEIKKLKVLRSSLLVCEQETLSSEVESVGLCPLFISACQGFSFLLILHHRVSNRRPFPGTDFISPLWPLINWLPNLAYQIKWQRRKKSKGEGGSIGGKGTTEIVEEKNPNQLRKKKHLYMPLSLGMEEKETTLCKKHKITQSSGLTVSMY